MPKNKETYTKNPRLKRPGVRLEFTKEQLDEYVKCIKDPIYFIENYVKIISLDKGVIPFKMWEWQKDIIRSFEEERFCVVKVGRQSGKCFDINTSIEVRNKTTGETFKTTIGEFKKLCQEKSNRTSASDVEESAHTEASSTNTRSQE